MAKTYLRFRITTPNRRGVLVGVFAMVNTLAKEGRLPPEQEQFRRTNNAWYDAAYIDPSTIDPTVYDWKVNPGATAWFKPTAQHLIERIDGYLKILDAHGVAWELVKSADPGRIIYEDEHQIVVVPVVNTAGGTEPLSTAATAASS